MTMRSSNQVRAAADKLAAEGLQEDIRKTLILAKRLGAVTGHDEAERQRAQEALMYEHTNRDGTGLTNSWNRAHDRMNSGFGELNYGASRAFHDAVKVAMGERAVDSGLNAEGTVALLQKMDVLTPMQKVALVENPVATGTADPFTASPRTLGESVELAKAAGQLSWREVQIEVLRQNGTTTVRIPRERLSLLSQWRAGHAPTGFMFSVGGIAVEPSEISWSGFESSLVAHGGAAPSTIVNRPGA